jgi:hypothetical protein
MVHLAFHFVASSMSGGCANRTVVVITRRASIKKSVFMIQFVIIM